MNSKTIPLTLLISTALAVLLNLAVGLPVEDPGSTAIIIGLIAIMAISFAAGAYWGFFQGRGSNAQERANARANGFKSGMRYEQEMQHYDG